MFGVNVFVNTPISHAHSKQIGGDTTKNISPFLPTVTYNKRGTVMSILVVECA
jgi:hypothetical protein